ncbi:MAG: CPBP family intramembrane metalloprotease [Clostridiales bacterium]|nr:CPBP family intramembrane metalloprotease [Clostridiales bacterium]
MTDKKAGNERKLLLKNLLIYLFITFALSWSAVFALNLSDISIDFADGSAGAANFVTTFGMLCPALGMIITRFITKEGHAFSGDGSMMLGIDLKNRKYVFYIIAVLLPWIYFELGNLLKIVLQPGCFDREYFSAVDSDVRTAYIYPLMGIVSGVFFSVGGLGEELGWRGYMMPKMIKLFGKVKGVVFGGIIWGIWHWPLTYAGHNFGKSYIGYPFAGFAAMCFICIVTGILLTFLTVRTGSIWPAAIMHAVNNTSPSIIQFFRNPDKAAGIMTNSIFSCFVYYIPALIIAVFVLIVWTKDKN